MHPILARPPLWLALGLALAAGGATAQEAATDGVDAQAAEVLSTGEPAAGQAATPPAAQPQGPQIYIREEHGDWEIRCLEAPEGQDDPCQMYQRMEDQNGNPTADVNIFDLPDGGEIAAGATILTPLQTLLTAQVTLSIDGGQPRRYPFSFCDEAGCYARLGLTAEEVAQMRRGNAATVVVVPAQAPDQEARLTMSLSGFTAGLASIEVANQ
jgi:invasion protein IalB